MLGYASLDVRGLARVGHCLPLRGMDGLMSPIGKVFRVGLIFWKDKAGKGQCSVFTSDLDCLGGSAKILKFYGPDYLRVVKGL